MSSAKTGVEFRQGARLTARGPRALVFALLLTAVVLFGSWAVVLRTSENGVQIGSDQWVSFAGATWGRQHRCVSGQPWQRALLSGFPVPRLFGGQITERASVDDRLVLWLRGKGHFGGLQIYGDHGPCYECDAVDEHGCRFGAALPAVTPDEDSALGAAFRSRRSLAIANLRAITIGRNGLIAAELPAFPRRANAFQVELWSTWDGRPFGPRLASFPVANPVHVPIPEWKPEPFPIEREVSGVRIRCLGIDHPLRTDVLPGYELSPAGARVSAIRVRASGRGCRWVPVQAITSDATGNSRNEMVQSEPGRRFIPGLCLHEPAWKLRLTFLPDSPRGTPDFVWKLRLPMPATGQVAPLRREWHAAGIRLETVQLAGAGIPDLTGSPPRGELTPTVDIRTCAAKVPFMLAVLSTGEGGGVRSGQGIAQVRRARETQSFTYDPDGFPSDDPYRVNLRDDHLNRTDLGPPSSGRTLELSLGIYLARTIEFYARP